MASFLGGGSASLLRARRDQVERNLVRILGKMAPRERRARVRRTFENYGRYWYEFFRLTRETKQDLLERVDVEGWEKLEAAIGAGGVIGVVPHLGAYDVVGAWMAARGVPLTVVVEAVEPPELFEWFLAQRSSFGMEVVPLGPDAGRTLVRMLGEGRVVALVGDRDLTDDGVEVELFGETTTLPAGPATLAFRTGARIVTAAAYFGSGERLSVVIDEPVPIERQGRLRDDVARVTQEIAHRFEVLIRRAPEQWFVLQPNWPSDTVGSA